MMPVNFPNKPWTILIYSTFNAERIFNARSNTTMTEEDDDCASVPSLTTFSPTEVHEHFSCQTELASLDNNSMLQQLDNTIHAAMLRQKLFSSMDEVNTQNSIDNTTLSEFSGYKRSKTVSNSVSELMNTLDDAPLFDPIIYTDSDYNQSDSQELVADYDDRPDAAYNSQSAPNLIGIVPILQQYDGDEMETEYNDSSQIIGEVNDCALVHHSQELEPSQIEAHNDAEVTSNVSTITKKKRRGNKQSQGQRQKRIDKNR